MPPSSIRDKYLQGYATEEAGLATTIDGAWDHVLVVPACAESPAMMAGYGAAAAGVSGRVLVIVVINAAADADDATHAANASLLRCLRSDYPATQPLADSTGWLHRGDCFDVLCLDFATGARRFGTKQGVGRARRIGCDLALALYHQGRLTTPWLHTTDGDARLPADYFHTPRETAVALTYRFRHTPGDLDPSHAAALALYEVSLRYYVAGLAHAGSPYAYHAIGSTMAVDATAYATVRGMPQRQAGEDFYVLNKLAKLGVIRTPPSEPIELCGRLSDRVPFGTGPATRRIAGELNADRDLMVYHPASFLLLRTWLSALETFATTRDWSAVDEAIDGEPRAHALRTALEHLGAPAAMRDAAHKCTTATALRRRCHEWMDAFRTLKLIHALRDQCLGMVPWRQAIAAPPLRLDSSAAPHMVCDVLARMEPTRAGTAIG